VDGTLDDVTLLTEIVATQQAISTSDFDLDAVMREIVRQTQRLTSGDDAVVEFVERDEMLYRAGAGTAKPHVGLRLPVNASLSGLCVSLGDIVICDDSELDSRVDREATRMVGARSMVVVPLAHREATAGVLKVYSGRPRAFSERELRILQMMTGTLGSALVRAELFERLELAATTDPITGLGNRRVWEERLPVEVSRAGRSGDLLTVVVLDLDGFKAYNDRFGHAAGDRLLCACAARWLTSVRAVDLLARIGGEEFGLLLPDCRRRAGLRSCTD